MIYAFYHGAKLLKKTQPYVQKLTQKVHILRFLLYNSKKSSTFVPFFREMANLADIRRPIEGDWKRYEKVLRETLRADDKVQQAVLNYILAQRGKQMRPLIVLLCAQICNPITDKTLKSAVALDLLHNASLVHDDVVDNSDTRRGKPAVHIQWTNKVAVLMGDYMLAQVIGLVAEVRNIRILEIVSDLGRNLSSGEVLQLHYGASMWINEEQYMRIIDQKTAQLFQSCAEAGAESAGCTQRQRTALRTYGNLLGLCFQIKDDLFDYSDLEELGKPTMSDLRDGKVTLPLIEALRRAPKEEAEEIKAKGERLVAKEYTEEEESRVLQEIKAFVMRFRGDEYAVQRMLTYKKQATEALSVFRDCPEKKSLLDLLDYAINRVQ